MLDPIINVLRLVLDFFYSYVGNYGIAIILLTIAVRLAMLPLTIKQTKSMKAMQILQPKIKELQAKYKDDKERLSQEMVKFYKENKFNPMAGCLPLLLQLPIMFALFRMLTDKQLATILAGQSFLWMGSLTAKDPILAIAMIGTTYYQQHMMATDPQQKSMMLPMTLFLGFIAWGMPAGVLLYWVVTNVLTISQQLLQNKTGSVKNEKSTTAAKKLKENEKVKNHSTSV